MGCGRTEFFSWVLFFCLVSCLTGSVRARNISIEEDLELDRELKILNKPAVKTIYGRYGEIFDCVDIYKQPAFDNPLLKDHKLQLNPTLPKKKEVKNNSSSSSLFNATMLDVKDIEIGEGGCPEGSVPIKRITKEELIRIKRYQERMRNQSLLAQQPNARTNQIWRKRHAKVHTQMGFSWLGANSIINIQHPNALRMEYSASSIRLANQADNIEAGWMVNRELYGDFATRLFTFWASGSRGCFIMRCEGFVLTSTSIPMGAIIVPLSVYGGVQYELEFGIYKDLDDGNWWLTYGVDNHKVGYWPRLLFNTMGQGAMQVEFGGVVYSCCPETFPPMGSGHYAHEGYRKAAYQRNLGLIDMEGEYFDPLSTNFYTWMDSENCYTSTKRRTPEWGTFTYFGGPGGRC